MASRSKSPSQSPVGEQSPADESPIPDDPNTEADLPLTMMASVVLTNLPRDATSALAAAGTFEKEKVTVQFRPVGNAPRLRQEVCKIKATQRFEAVVSYLRRVLKVGPTENVFLYINASFAPALDEIVGNLHRCFRRPLDDQLVVSYSMTPAFG